MLQVDILKKEKRRTRVEKKIRIKDIAQMAGVSATTVSNVVHNRQGNVSAKTRKRIEEIIREQGYTPSAGAVMLSGKASRIIAVVAGKMESQRTEGPEMAEVLKIIGEQLQERHYYMLLYFAKSAADFLEFAAAWKLDGMILLWMPETECEEIRTRCRIPVVHIRMSGEWMQPKSRVGVWYRAGEEAAGYLLKNGLVSIWFLDGTEKGRGTEIWRGIQRSCSRKEVVLTEERYLEIPKDREMRKMYYKIRLAALAFSAQVLVFASGRQGAEAVGYLNDMGIRVPEEVAVFGIGGGEAVQFGRPQLTTVEIDRKKMVIQMVECLFRNLTEHPVEWKTEKIKVKTVVRESCICRN